MTNTVLKITIKCNRIDNIGILVTTFGERISKYLGNIDRRTETVRKYTIT